MSRNLNPRCIRVHGVVLTGVMALLALGLTLPAQAQPPVGPTDVAAADKIGVTLYQANGFSGKIPLRLVFEGNPQTDMGHYELKFASDNMNTKMDWKAKFKMPAGMIFKSFELGTANGPIQVTPAGADSWDGQTLIDTVSLSPWNLNRVLQQCIDHLKQPDGSFKDSATFDLQADLTELVRGKGICAAPNAPPGNASSYSGQATPKTRVTAYIVNPLKKATVDGRPDRLSLPRPARLPPSDSSIGGAGRQPASGSLVLPTGPRLPQPASAGRLIAEPKRTEAKETFKRTKPHVNVGTVPGRLSPQP